MGLSLQDGDGSAVAAHIDKRSLERAKPRPEPPTDQQQKNDMGRTIISVLKRGSSGRCLYTRKHNEKKIIQSPALL